MSVEQQTELSDKIQTYCRKNMRQSYKQILHNGSGEPIQNSDYSKNFKITPLYELKKRLS